MSYIQKKKERNLWFSQRVTEAMSKIFDHPLTIVEAPMGYGKTTAVREHMILTSANLLWQNVYDDSEAAFWSDFCLLFEELDDGCAHSLAQLGFPDDSVSLHAALTLIKNIALLRQTVIVIDDFHLVDTQETTNLITFLAINEIANLYIVLISRFCEFFSVEELSLGSSQSSECKIDSIAQTWAVISGGGNPQRAKIAMNSLLDYLVQWEDGLIKLLTPAFDCGEAEPGYIKGYVPGVRENGGQYTHAAAWAIIAFAKLGDGDKAWELFRLINPKAYRQLYGAFQIQAGALCNGCGCLCRLSPCWKGGWSWYTGSAGWMYRAGLEYILGFQKNGGAVILDPCIPQKWQEYAIKYKFIDTMYDIRVENPQGLNKGVKSISLDGEISEGNRLQLVNDGKSHEVLVLMGL